MSKHKAAVKIFVQSEGLGLHLKPLFCHATKSDDGEWTVAAAVATPADPTLYVLKIYRLTSVEFETYGPFDEVEVTSAKVVLVASVPLED